LTYEEKLKQNPRFRKRFRDSLVSYVMTQLPFEHEKTIALFADRALFEAYQNGQQDGRK
jgi:hypothetical protein|tara:strand:+ start:1385 stop:1561 length:177 start_codon:yes stop_codon:yes gene_type:complete